MRAIWEPSLLESAEYTISGDALHHLVNVIRIELDEEILLLNGKGLSVKAKTKRISKRDILLEHVETIKSERVFSMDVALGIPKKEALELCLKEATELGIRRLYLIRAAFSQIKIPDADRIEKMLVSALEQSNAPFLPEVIEVNWKDIPWNDYSVKLLMDSQSKCRSKERISSEKSILVVGPEGGFSFDELSYLHSLEGMEVLTLPTPILRTPTALATGTGMLLQRLMDRF